MILIDQLPEEPVSFIEEDVSLAPPANELSMPTEPSGPLITLDENVPERHPLASSMYVPFSHPALALF